MTGRATEAAACGRFFRRRHDKPQSDRSARAAPPPLGARAVPIGPWQLGQACARATRRTSSALIRVIHHLGQAPREPLWASPTQGGSHAVVSIVSVHHR